MRHASVDDLPGFAQADDPRPEAAGRRIAWAAVERRNVKQGDFSVERDRSRA